MATLFSNDGSDLVGLTTVTTHGTVASNGTIIELVHIDAQGWGLHGFWTDAVTGAIGVVGYLQWRTDRLGIAPITDQMIQCRTSGALSTVGTSTIYKTSNTTLFTGWETGVSAPSYDPPLLVNTWYDLKVEIIAGGLGQWSARPSLTTGLSSFDPTDSSWNLIGDGVTGPDFRGVDFRLVCHQFAKTVGTDIGFVVITDDGTITSAAGVTNYGNDLSFDLSIDMGIKQGI